MPRKPRAIGLNHIALEVGDIHEALDFYGAIFDFELRSRSARMAFIDMGDQFIALAAGRTQPADDGRHFGLVVDDMDAAREGPPGDPDRLALGRVPIPITRAQTRGSGLPRFASRVFTRAGEWVGSAVHLGRI